MALSARSFGVVAVFLLACCDPLSAQEESEEDRRESDDSFYREATIKVHVVDEAGKPAAGVPVSAVFPVGDRLVPAFLGTRFVVSDDAMPPVDVQAETNGEGDATLEIGRAGMPLAMFAGAIGPRKMRVRVQVNAPIAESPHHEFVMGALPKEPLTLVLPRAVALTLRIVTAEGKPETRPAQASIAFVDRGAAPAIRGVTISAKDGIARFPIAPLGRRIVVAARVENEPRPRSVETSVATHDRDPTVVLRPSDTGDDTEAALRILRPSGEPAAHQFFSVRIECGPAFVVSELSPATAKGQGLETKFRAFVRTDGEGHTRLRVRGLANPDPWIDTRVWLAPLLLPFIPGPETEVLIPRGIRRGADDFGDLRLRRPVPLARGTAIDPDLKPLDGVEVRLERMMLNLWGVPLPEVSTSAMNVGFRPWMPVPGSTASTTERGAYRLFGHEGPQPLRLVATKPGYMHAPQEQARSGAEPRKVVLHPAAQLEGRVILDPDIPTSAVRIDIRGDFEKRMGRKSEAPSWSAQSLFETFGGGWLSKPVSADGSFKFPSLPGGTARVAVIVSDVEAAVFTKIPLVEGQIALPQGLQDVDLRGRVSTCHLRVLDEHDRPVPRARVSLYSQRKSVRSPTVFVTDSDGVARIVSLQEEVTASINGPVERGFKRADWKGRLEGTVRLEKEPRVRFSIKDLSALPRPPYFLACFLESEAEAAQSKQERDFKRGPFGNSERGAKFDGSGIGLTRIEAPGTYHVRPMLWVIMPDCGWDVPLEFNGPKVVELRADGTDAVEIDVDPAKVHEAVIRSAKALWH